MSAFAFVTTENVILGFSDGMEVDLENHKPIGSSARKVYKVSDRCLMFQTGVLFHDNQGRTVPELVRDRAQQAGVTYPQDVAEITHRIVQNLPAGGEAERLHFVLLGFDGDGSIRYFTWNNLTRDRITEEPMPAQQIGIIAYQADEEAKQMFLSLFTHKLNNQGILIDQAASEAWEQTVRHYENEGYLFGGELFMETVSKKGILCPQ